MHSQTDRQTQKRWLGGGTPLSQMHRDRHRDRQTDRHTYRQTDRQTYRQTDIQTDRQAHIHLSEHDGWEVGSTHSHGYKVRHRHRHPHTHTGTHTGTHTDRHTFESTMAGRWAPPTHTDNGRGKWLQQ